MKRTQKELVAYRDLLAMESEMRETMREVELMEFLPDGWHSLEKDHPTHPQKKQVTLRLDGDVLRWYRNMGQGYQARINATLRLFMLARVSKAVRPWEEME